MKDGMSVKQIRIHDKPIYFDIDDAPNDAIKIKAYFGLDCPRAEATIDRNQAHLLYLYLKERFEP